MKLCEQGRGPVPNRELKRHPARLTPGTYLPVSRYRFKGSYAEAYK